MTTYYHVSRLSLSAGKIVQPGGLGIWLRESCSTGPRGDEGNLAKLSRELIFESFRLQCFAAKPSRLDANFLFEDLQVAQKYGEYLIPDGIIYEVFLVDEAAKIHRGDFGLFLPHDLQYQCSFVNFNEQLAVKYWGRLGTQGDIEYVEVLTESTVCIVRQVQRVNCPAPRVPSNTGTAVHS